MIKGVKGGIGFLTTLPVGRNFECFEAFRRRTYLMVFVGIFTGLILSFLCFFLFYLKLKFLTPLAIISVEGINHFDGLLDFGDAVFVPKERKKEVLKDLNTGAGGTFFAVLWVACLAFASNKLDLINLVLTAFTAEVCAKLSMLIMLSTTNPLWKGMGSSFVEFSSFKRTVSLTLALLAFFVLLQFYFGFVLYLFLSAIVFTILFRFYILRSFGGSNGDIFGAANCLTLLVVFLTSVCLHSLGVGRWLV